MGEMWGMFFWGVAVGVSAGRKVIGTKKRTRVGFEGRYCKLKEAAKKYTIFLVLSLRSMKSFNRWTQTFSIRRMTLPLKNYPCHN